jgi:hypothetical protein
MPDVKKRGLAVLFAIAIRDFLRMIAAVMIRRTLRILLQAFTSQRHV